jgi:hypothetical protein
MKTANAAPAAPAHDGRPAPLDGCPCAVCVWANDRVARDADIALNYERYLAGDLVSRDVRE